MENKMLSETGVSNLYTMSASAKKDKRQEIPDTYTMPSLEVRKLRAQLILEEALETIEGLGFSVGINVAGDCEIGKQIEPDYSWQPVEISNVEYEPLRNGPNLEKIIDGCCDVIYVAVGTMLCCGAPDGEHMKLVNDANNAKFPNGEAITNENGKFQKPKGWLPPDHGKLINSDDLKNAMRALKKRNGVW